MSNEIVKYNNRMNTIPLGKLSANELNLFITLVQRAYQKGTSKQVYSFTQLKSLSKYDRSTSNFIKDIMRTNSKLLSINAYTDDGDTIKQFACFNTFEIVRSKQLLRVAVNPDFQGLFNDLKNWTRFQLEQFNNIKSAYAKNLYRLIKQYRTVGRLKLTKEELFKQLDIPTSYAQKISRVQQRVITPVKEELAPIIRGLAVKTIRGAGRGRPVTGYVFTWHPESKNADDFSKGHFLDKSKMLENIDLNDDLTPKEKGHAYDRVLGLTLGTTDISQWKKADNSKDISEAQQELTEQDKLKQFNELIKSWIKYFPNTPMSITGKLQSLLEQFGLEKLKEQIERYSVFRGSIEANKILEMIENSLQQGKEY